MNKSTFYNLSDYGKRFPQFLKELDNLNDLPFITDLAKFDWTFKEIFSEKQHVSIEPSKLQELKERPNSKLIFGNAVRIFESEMSVYDIWQLRKEELQKAPDINFENSEYLLLYKKFDEIFVKNLSETQCGILKSLKLGQTFSSVLDDMSEINQEDVINLFQIIGTTGIITQIE